MIVHFTNAFFYYFVFHLHWLRSKLHDCMPSHPINTLGLIGTQLVKHPMFFWNHSLRKLEMTGKHSCMTAVQTAGKWLSLLISIRTESYWSTLPIVKNYRWKIGKKTSDDSTIPISIKSIKPLFAYRFLQSRELNRLIITVNCKKTFKANPSVYRVVL